MVTVVNGVSEMSVGPPVCTTTVSFARLWQKLGHVDKFSIKPSMPIFAKFRLDDFEISFAQSNVHIFTCLPTRLGNVRIDRPPDDSNPGSVRHETVTVYFYCLCAWYPSWRTDFRPQQDICPQNHRSSLLTHLRVSNGERVHPVHHDRCLFLISLLSYV
jgi:hypothetical protein